MGFQITRTGVATLAQDAFFFERQARRFGQRRIAGVDEAGRGPLAGPVVAAAVILPEGFSVSGVDDSKKLTAARRLRAFARICREAAGIGVGVVDAATIDRINILQASLLAMAMAVAQLRPSPDGLLIDGRHMIDWPLPQRAIPHGDARSVSIAAASIVAKVTRDRLMERYHERYPAFGFVRHKGYPTQAHRQAVATHGPSPIHRRSFKGVKELL
jgi:ribonuclease HII